MVNRTPINNKNRAVGTALVVGAPWCGALVVCQAGGLPVAAEQEVDEFRHIVDGEIAIVVYIGGVDILGF